MVDLEHSLISSAGAMGRKLSRGESGIDVVANNGSTSALMEGP